MSYFGTTTVKRTFAHEADSTVNTEQKLQSALNNTITFKDVVNSTTKSKIRNAAKFLLSSESITLDEALTIAVKTKTASVLTAIETEVKRRRYTSDGFKNELKEVRRNWNT